MFDRDKVIEILIDDDFQAIREGFTVHGDNSYLYNLLYNGHLGYDRMFEHELIKECEERDISYLVAPCDDAEA